MLFILCTILGVLAGLSVIKLTRQFREANKSRIIIFLPSSIAIISAVILMYIGNVKIEGIDGAAYMLLSMIIFVFGGTVLYLTDKKMSK